METSTSDERTRGVYGMSGDGFRAFADAAAAVVVGVHTAGVFPMVCGLIEPVTSMFDVHGFP